MSTAARGSLRAVAPVNVPGARVARCARVRWALADGALEWTVREGPEPSAHAVLRRGEEERRLTDPASVVEFIDDPASGLVHVRVASREGELFRASIDPSRGVVYARTSLLERLAIPGGRYEVAEGRVERGA